MKTSELITDGGFRIPEFGKRNGLTAIRSRDVNEHLIARLNSLGKMSVKRGQKDAWHYAGDNVVLELTDNGAGGLGSWRWAEPKEYANATVYTSGQVVIVSPSNPSIADCTAGLWVSKLEVGAANFPLWNGAAPSTYWQLISFYPAELTVCVDGVDTQYYFNAQEAP